MTDEGMQQLRGALALMLGRAGLRPARPDLAAGAMPAQCPKQCMFHVEHGHTACSGCISVKTALCRLHM